MTKQETATLTFKTVKELMSHSLKVPNYQRGYKWTSAHVTKLLEDIEQFSEQENEFYCLQPVVVKKNGTQWELIDGQQRVTTIWMILSYLNHDIDGKLQYDTRSSSEEFINDLKAYFARNLEERSKDSERSKDNIDIYHFKKACDTIQKWFEKRFEEKDPSLKKTWLDKWLAKLLNHSKVIWYTADQSDNSKDVFRRLNSGKIPLTNAELIKALFLINSSSTENKELFDLKKSQIAREWDEIEYGLQQDDFWDFLNGSAGKPYATRIEFIFDLLHPKKTENEDRYFTFYEYTKLLEHLDLSCRAEKVLELWKSVKQSYYRFRQWYANDNLYHRVGFLLFCRYRASPLGCECGAEQSWE